MARKGERYPHGKSAKHATASKLKLLTADMNRSIRERRLAELRKPTGEQLKFLKRFGGNPTHTRKVHLPWT